MRKILLSVFILGSFGSYVLWQGQSNSQVAVLSSQSITSKNDVQVAQTDQPIVPTEPSVSFPENILNAIIPNLSKNSTKASTSNKKSKSKKTTASKSVAVGSTPVATPTPTLIKKQGIYNDGTYTGSVADAYWGSVQVEAIISNGRISDVQFLDYPQDRNTSIRINSRAMPSLIQKAISVQSANVAKVSGASDTSAAFKQSLASALTQAKA